MNVAPPAGPLASLIVPVYRDRPELAALLAAVDRPDGLVETIVVDGTPGGCVAPLRGDFRGVQWLESAPGRATQMNHGAAHATGRWLVFLHADTRLDDGWIDELHRADRQDEVVGGCFRFALRSEQKMARVIERGVAWRVRWLNLPYGDQCLFARRGVFEKVGGYPPIRLMEDVALVRALARRGRLLHSQVAARVSPRRWERDGWARRTAGNLTLLSLYCAGVDPERLARWYYHEQS